MQSVSNRDHEPRSRSRPSAADVVLAAVITIAQVGLTIAVTAHQDEGVSALGLILVAAGPIALAWRRRYPRTVYAIVFATALGYWVGGYPFAPVFFALIVAFITVMLAGHRILAWGSIIPGYVAFQWLGVLFDTRSAPSLAGAFGLAAWLLVLATTTQILRYRNERATTLAHARDEEQRARANEERLQISRELHDIVAHNLSLINVQAGTALHLIHDHPDVAEPALSAIKQASKEGLDELRSLLEILRQGGPDAEIAPRTPTPTLADLSSLVDRTTAAGIPVDFHIDGPPRPVPIAVETAAYRVTQEALTNVVRHAGTAHTIVKLTYGPDSVVIQIDDDGPGRHTANASGSGKGLTGMRERVHALGGRLDAGPRPGHGFRVRAWIPTESPT